MTLKARQYPVPANEPDRLAHLDELGIIDSLPEPQFDALVGLARTMFRVPIALIGLMGRTEQRFKAIQGLVASSAQRDAAFCAYPVANGDVMIVEDASEDPRFKNNPHVTGGLGIRFYAGAPIAIEPGLVLGTLCITDTSPRRFSEEESASLVEMAEIASALIRQFRDARKATDLARMVQEQGELLSKQTRELSRYKRIFDRGAALINAGAWEWDLENGEVTWTDNMFRMHGLPLGSELSSSSVSDMYTPESSAELRRLFTVSDVTQAPFTFEGEMITVGGQRRWIRLTVDVETRDGRVVRRFGLKQDITEEKAMVDKLRYLADFDPLTTLPNRVVLQNRLADISNPALSPVCALLLVDLDGFKHVNDTYGHEAGDACLTQIAARLQRSVSGSRLVSRLGGDEFAVLLEGENLNASIQCANRILETVRVPIRLHGNSFHLSASIGIAVGEAPDDRSHLLTRADLALYAAKEAGRNTFRLFVPEMKSAAESRFETVRSISVALAKDQLELFYQPQINLVDESLAGFEALVRWRRPDGQVLTAGAFAAAFEDPELSRNIGAWVVESALKQAQQWQRSGLPFGHIAINVSASQFRDPDFAEGLIDRIAFYGLEAKMIEAEVTEGVFLSEENGSVRRALDVLRAAGVRISLDDFGTGFASLSHLRNYPVDILKIDRSFVQHFLTSDRDHAILQSTLFLARHLQMYVVAEGVEEDEQCQFLRALGCQVVQGFLYSKALPASEAALWCGRRLSRSA